MSSPFPVWDNDPLLHLFAVDEDTQLTHETTFVKGFIAAMRLTHATSQQLEDGWAKQAAEIFHLYLKRTRDVAEYEDSLPEEEP